jgi:hypothetical protein
MKSYLHHSIILITTHCPLISNFNIIIIVTTLEIITIIATLDIIFHWSYIQITTIIDEDIGVKFIDIGTRTISCIAT